MEELYDEDAANLIPVSEPSGTDLPANTSTAGLLPFDHSVTGAINSTGGHGLVPSAF